MICLSETQHPVNIQKAVPLPGKSSVNGAITNGHWPNWSLAEVVTTRVVTDHNGHRTGGHRPKWSLTQVVTTLAVTTQVVTKIKF